VTAVETEVTRRLVLGELAAVNRQDPHGLADHFAEHCEFVDLSDGTRINGKADFLEDLVGLFSAVPDFHVAHSRVIAEGGIVAAEIRLSGTPASEWRGFEPTGRPFVWETCSFYDLDADGEHLLRERMYYDAAALEAQLGAPVA
jgi:predicted ester cyclase